MNTENVIFELSDEAIERRFWSRVDRAGAPDACWNWTGYRGSHGYGRLTIKYRDLLSHRVAYVLAHGSITDGLWVLHTCDNRACANPSHIFLGTTQDNNADRTRKGRSAKGLRNGSHTMPDRRPRGERHGTRTSPGRLPAGDEHYTRMSPELVPRGTANGMARLTEDSVLDIRRQYAAGGVSLMHLARLHNVTKQNIWHVVKRKTWAHIP